jgi:guanylate kinase
MQLKRIINGASILEERKSRNKRKEGRDYIFMEKKSYTKQKI